MGQSQSFPLFLHSSMDYSVADVSNRERTAHPSKRRYGPNRVCKNQSSEFCNDTNPSHSDCVSHLQSSKILEYNACFQDSQGSDTGPQGHQER